jgi:hypothetical protein
MTSCGSGRRRGRLAKKRKAREPEADAQRQRLVEEARTGGKAIEFAVDGKVEIPLPSRKRVSIAIPDRTSGFEGWTYPVRVVLTPPAVGVDVVYAVMVAPIAAVGLAGDSLGLW